MTRLWDYLCTPGRSKLRAWADEEKLDVRERAQLNQKLDMLERVGFDTACRLSFVSGASSDFNQIFKLIVMSQRMLRPILCRGPADAQDEITLLYGALEKDSELKPPNAAERADHHRRCLINAGDDCRQEMRANHERF